MVWLEPECTDQGFACYSFKVISEKSPDLSISSGMMLSRWRLLTVVLFLGFPWRVPECDDDVHFRGVVCDARLLSSEHGHGVRSRFLVRAGIKEIGADPG